jgi:predicted metalloprotease with PDZ domain
MTSSCKTVLRLLCICNLFALIAITTTAHTRPTTASAQAANAPATLTVDAREAPRNIFHAHLTLQVAPGPLTLVYPKWIPGEHGPTGPLVQVAGLELKANGQTIAWQRDGVDMYAIHCEIPAGAHTLDVALDYLSPVTTFAGNGYGFTPNATARLAIVLWNQLLLYPQGKPSDELVYHARLRLPAGWHYGTALPVTSDKAETIDFAPVSLTTLVDSPLIAGQYFRVVPLASEQNTSAEIDMVADSAAALEMSPELVAHYKKLIAEAGALFGAYHYRHYHFLLTLSDQMDFNGLEHHESSDDRAPEQMLLVPSLRAQYATLLPHEYTHSWNGKYRRPAGLATPDYQQPMQGELLWVYEGMTQYIGNVLLTSRSGLRSFDDSLDYLAYVAANLDNSRPGRRWRPLVDTAIAAQVLYGGPTEWTAWRRGADYYDEGLLIWLEADSIIRQQTNGQRSLNDFCRSFHGGQTSPPRVVPYTFDDVVAAFNQVAPYDWRTFLRTRIYEVRPRAPLGGIEASGWRLTYTDAPNTYMSAREQNSKVYNFSFSVGLWLREDGTVTDIVQGLAADEAGLSPGMKVVGVQGNKWAVEAMREALRATKATSTPLELVVEQGNRLVNFRLNYHDGERYPHLVRDASRPDLLAQILKPLT